MKKQGLDNGIPISTSLRSTLENEKIDNSRSLVLRRVVYVSLLAVTIAAIMGFIAKFLVMLIYLFTNLAFFGRWSFTSVSPQYNALGFLVLLPPVIGGVVIAVWLYGAHEPLGGTAYRKQWNRYLPTTVR